MPWCPYWHKNWIFPFLKKLNLSNKNTLSLHQQTFVFLFVADSLRRNQVCGIHLKGPVCKVSAHKIFLSTKAILGRKMSSMSTFTNVKILNQILQSGPFIKWSHSFDTNFRANVIKVVQVPSVYASIKLKTITSDFKCHGH